MKRLVSVLCLLVLVLCFCGCGDRYATGGNARNTRYATSGGVFYYATSGSALPFISGMFSPVASAGNAG